MLLAFARSVPVRAAFYTARPKGGIAPWAQLPGKKSPSQCIASRGNLQCLDRPPTFHLQGLDSPPSPVGGSTDTSTSQVQIRHPQAQLANLSAPPHVAFKTGRRR